MRFFNQVTLSTTESLSIGNQALALMIDYLVLGTILFAVLFTWGTLSIQIPQPITDQISPWLFC